jgi:cystathionine beta-lyase
LPEHPGYELHSQQATGGGSVISFTTGDVTRSKHFVESTRLCSIAVSFGSVNSSISLPCYMSHASIPESMRSRLAPPTDLIRLSVGIEDIEDVIADLEQAFGTIRSENTSQGVLAASG